VSGLRRLSGLLLAPLGLSALWTVRFRIFTLFSVSNPSFLSSETPTRRMPALW
jgi:hypothetical protein